MLPFPYQGNGRDLPTGPHAHPGLSVATGLTLARLHAVRCALIAREGGIPWMVVPSDGVGVLGRQLSDELSAALSRLYVRILRPDKKCCTLRHRAGAGIQVRHRGVDADARESRTECAKIQRRSRMNLLLRFQAFCPYN